MNTNWTPEELEYVKTGGKSKNPYHLGQKLNRSGKAVYHKAMGNVTTRAVEEVTNKYRVGLTVKVKSVVHEKIMEGVITYIHTEGRFVVVSFNGYDKECFPIYALME